MITRRSVLSGGAATLAASMMPPSPAALAATVSPALFVVAHPDDETLAMGVAIAEHLAAGQDVHVFWLTDGEASGVTAVLNGTATSGWWGVRHVPAAEGYTPLTAADLAAARIRESATAVRCLAAGQSGTLTTHRAGLPDGGVTESSARAAILAVADAIAPGGPVRLKGHSQTVDNHPDHVAVGQAIRSLRTSDQVRFGDVRHYVLPTYWSDARLSQVTWAWDTPTDASIAARARNACRAYGAWAPAAGMFAIGYHSVAGMFDKLTPAPKCLYHT